MPSGACCVEKVDPSVHAEMRRGDMCANHMLFIIFILAITQVTSLSLCETNDRYLEFEMKQDNRFTCRDIPATSTVTWTLTDRYNVSNLGTCPPPAGGQQSTCNASSLAPGMFISYRTSDNTSFLVYNATADPTPNVTGRLRLGCKTETDETSCPLDYICRPSLASSSCIVQFNINLGSVSGECNVTKMFSLNRRYRCLFYESSQNQSENLIHVEKMHSVTSTDSGNCGFSRFLPPDGRYNYTAVIYPGEVTFPVVFRGSNEIRTPSTKPNHNCPNIVQEGQDIQCACSVSDYGSPSGTLQWDNTGSTQLSLINVMRGDTGRRFVCRLTWKNVELRTPNYTLIVATAPMIVDLKLNSSNVDVTVSENTTVTLSCQAIGRPLPRMDLIKDSNQVLSALPVGDITTADLERELKYSISNVQCDESGHYTCEVNNGVGRDRRTIMLFVQCPPRASQSDTCFQSVTFTDKEVRLQFNLTAFPTPEVASVIYIGPSGVSNCSRRPAPEFAVSAECTSAKEQLSSVVCTATVHNITLENVGIYRITIRNIFGQLELVFEVKISDEESQFEPLTADECSNGFAFGIGVGIGVTVGVFGVLHIAGVIWMRRRNWVLPCVHFKETPTEQLVSSAEEQDSPEYSHASGNTYDALHLEDLGKKSVYSSINTENQGTRESADYELPIESASNQGQPMHRQRTQTTAS